jgi:hypothetical protein
MFKYKTGWSSQTEQNERCNKSNKADLQTKAIDWVQQLSEKKIKKTNKDVKISIKSNAIGNKRSEVIKDDFKVEFEANKGYQNIVAGQRNRLKQSLTASISGNTSLCITRDWSIRS